MKVNLKRIIAREGLIIIAILLLLGATFLISSKITQHKIGIEDYKLYTIETEDGRIFQIPAKNESILSARVDEAITNDRDGKGQDFINKTYAAEITKAHKSIELNRMSQIAAYGVIFLIVAYPVYLVLRFVLWAIKTLKY